MREFENAQLVYVDLRGIERRVRGRIGLRCDGSSYLNTIDGRVLEIEGDKVKVAVLPHRHLRTIGYLNEEDSYPSNERDEDFGRGDWKLG